MNVAQNLLQLAVPFRQPLTDQTRSESDAPASGLFIRPLSFFLGPTCDPNGDDQNNKDDDTKLPELSSSDPPENGYIGQWEESKSIADDVAGLSHPAMPGVTGIELTCRGDIEKNVPQGSL